VLDLNSVSLRHIKAVFVSGRFNFMLGIVIAPKSLYPERSSFLETRGVRRIIANRNNGQGGANLAVEDK